MEKITNELFQDSELDKESMRKIYGGLADAASQSSHSTGYTSSTSGGGTHDPDRDDEGDIVPNQ